MTLRYSLTFTQDHLDFHKTMEEYRDAKGLLFSQLGNVYGEQNPKYAVLNADDETYERVQRNNCCTSDYIWY